VIGVRGAVPGILVLAAALAAGVFASRTEPDPDFLRLHAAGALVARGEAGTLYDRAPRAAGPAGERAGPRPFRMPPAAAVALAPLGALPEGTAWVLWIAAGGAMAAGGIALAAAAAAREGASTWTPGMAAGVPLAPLLLEAVGRGGTVLPLLALGAGSLLALRRGRDRTAGALAGAAAVLKLAPILLPLWFAWKRRWRAAAWALGVAAALFVLLPVAAAGPSGGARLLGKWAGMESPLVTELDERPGSSANAAGARIEGQSVPAVLDRLLAGWRWYRLREMPLEEGPGGRPEAVAVGLDAPLSQGTVTALGLGGVFLLLVLGILVTGPATAAARLPLEGGLALALVPLAWVEARPVHFLLCAPALAALAAAPRTGTAGRVATGLASAGALLLLLSSDIVPGRALADALLARGSAGWGGFLLVAASALTLSRSPPP
jgi:hypothetical protein